MSHKNLDMFKISQTVFATVCNTSMTPSRIMRTFHDSFKTSSRSESQNSREPSHVSEIGALYLISFLFPAFVYFFLRFT